MSKKSEKMSFNATWSMAVGGMVGGGIFSVLGVIIETAGKWAWLSFVIAGLIALISAHSYSQLSLKYQKGGGAFIFLRELNYKGLAGSLAWVLILGYILTISVYAFTFGHYVAHVFNMGAWFPRALAFAIIALLTLVNLRGVGDASKVEIVTVWGKLFVLLGLSLIGITHWAPEQLSAGIQPRGWHTAIIGAATIFMAYEGFQLLSYDFNDIKNPKKNLPLATLTAVSAVIVIYILVTLGATMLVGAHTIIEQKEVALSIAGKQAFGLTGLILVTIAAAFSTGSAINATLFSTGRLMEIVAEKKDLPAALTKENKAHMPYYSLLIIASFAAVLSVIGSLGSLVDAASLIFLITFGSVNLMAWHQKVKFRILCFIGFLGCATAILLSSYQQVSDKPWQLGLILAFILTAIFARKWIHQQINK
ncbi:MAG: APC family permease [Daejeonella sp.]